MQIHEVALRAAIFLSGRPAPAIVRSLSLDEIELEVGEVDINARRVSVELWLGDAEESMRASGEVARVGPGSLALRIISFAPGGRARLERFLDGLETLSLEVVDETPILLDRARARPRPAAGQEHTRPMPQVVTSIPPGARRVATPIASSGSGKR